MRGGAINSKRIAHDPCFFENQTRRKLQMVIDILNLKTPVPCIQGFFGNRLVAYSTQVSPNQIINLLGHDPRSKNWKRLPENLKEIYDKIQRTTDVKRRGSVSAYIAERLGPNNICIGAFPAISIAFQNPTEFVSYGGSVPSAVGALMVDISPTNVRVLIDGLGRITGAMDLADENQGDILNNFLFPVTIYVPAPGTKQLSWDEMGQLFHDFNFRVHPVSKQHAIALDKSDIYIALANKLAKCSFIRDNGGVAERAASLGGKSTELVVQTVLVRTVRGACEGRRFQESNLAMTHEPNLTRQTFTSLLSSIDEFFSGIAARMGEKRFTDRHDSFHLSAPGWQALGVIHHDLAFKLKLDAVERSRVLDRIAAIDWGRGNPEWQTLAIGHAEVDKKTGLPAKDATGRVKVSLTGAGRTTAQKLIDYIRDKAGVTSRLKAFVGDEAEAA
jgi:hypothetical protein